MKLQVHLDGETYIVESHGNKYQISKKTGRPDTEEAILVLRAIQEGKGKEIK